MANDYRVKRRSNEELREDATRYHKGFIDHERRTVDIRAEIESGWVNTVAGRKRLIVRVLDDQEMGANDGLTEVQSNCVVMHFKRSVYSSLCVGDGRARFTAAHELAHARLNHDKAPMARGTGVNADSKKPKFIEKSESAEHQANEWASYYLISDAHISTCKTPEELAINCGVSVSAATIRFERFFQTLDRKRSGENVRKLAEAFKQDVCPTTTKIHYANIVCNRCGQKTVIPVGVKFLCLTCDAVTDNFQDGDPTGE